MSLVVQIVPLEYVHSVFEHVMEYIDNALQYSHGDYTLDEARVYIANGDWQLMIAVDEDNTVHGCAVISYFNRPRARVAYVVAAGGKFITDKDVIQQFFGLLKMHGATCAEAATRNAMAKLLQRCGFAEKYRIVECEL